MKNRAFTLVELLVAIGIIGVLIALLVPTVGAVRRASWNASSLNTMNNLRVAIEAYYGDHQAYPGLFHNGAPGPASISAGMMVDGVPMTQTENLVASLLGGITAVPANGLPGAVTFDTMSLGKGQAGMNPLNPKRYPAYLQPSALNMPGQPFTQWANDSIIPEAMDAYPDAMPILYLRARVGAPAVAAADDSAQYNYSHLAPYGFTDTSADFAGSTVGQRFAAYFTIPQTNAARNRDSYILIMAGPDRRYGTKDDASN